MSGAGEFLILETKGYDPRAEIKTQATERWVSAVNAAKSFGHWQFKMARSVGQVRTILDDAGQLMTSFYVTTAAGRRCSRQDGLRVLVGHWERGHCLLGGAGRERNSKSRTAKGPSPPAVR